MRTIPATPAEVDTWLAVLHHSGHLDHTEPGPDHTWTVQRRWHSRPCGFVTARAGPESEPAAPLTMIYFTWGGLEQAPATAASSACLRPARRDTVERPGHRHLGRSPNCLQP